MTWWSPITVALLIVDIVCVPHIQENLPLLRLSYGSTAGVKVDLCLAAVRLNLVGLYSRRCRAGA